VRDKIAVAEFSWHGHLDNLDAMFSVPWHGSSRKSLASYVDDTTGLFRGALQLTILMKSNFPQDSGKNETVEQTQTLPKEKGDQESDVSSQC